MSAQDDASFAPGPVAAVQDELQPSVRSGESAASARSRVIDQLVKTCRRPGRIWRLGDPGLGKVILDTVRQPGTWSQEVRLGLRVRRYGNYGTYLRHQMAKPHSSIDPDHDERFRAALATRLRGEPRVTAGLSVLCLGARWGTEVKAFHDLGCCAVGVDIKPGAGTAIVLQGDFHNLAFPAKSVDIVYTNSLDHAADIERLLAEILRVVKPDGSVHVEAALGRAQGHPPGTYESFYWESIDAVVNLLVVKGLRRVRRSAFDQPWAGEHLVLAPGA